MKKSFIILGVILAAAAAFILAFPGYNPFAKKAAPAVDPLADTNQAPAATITKGSFNPAPPIVQDANGFPLMIGSKNTFVSQMQTALNSRFGSELVVDGVFGIKTAKALSAHGYNPDAIYYKHFNSILGKG